MAPVIMTHSGAVQPIPRLQFECRVVNEGVIEGIVLCPTFIVEVNQDEMETSLEDDCEIDGTNEQDELVVSIEEDDC